LVQEAQRITPLHLNALRRSLSGVIRLSRRNGAMRGAYCTLRIYHSLDADVARNFHRKPSVSSPT